MRIIHAVNTRVMVVTPENFLDLGTIKEILGKLENPSYYVILDPGRVAIRVRGDDLVTNGWCQ